MNVLDIGKKVLLVNGRDIHGLVTGCLIRDGLTLFEVSWIHNGEAKTAFFNDFELELI